MKYNRHSRILDIIEKHEIETQDDLAEKLRTQGLEVTQATISRDIKELRLVKVMTQDGRYRYAAMVQETGSISDRLRIILRESFVSVDYANNILVVKTLPGMAQAIGSAVDSLFQHEVVGCIAGDDTLMVICRAEKMAEELMDRITRMVKGA